MPKKNVGGVATFAVKVNCTSAKEAKAFVNSLCQHALDIGPSNFVHYDGKYEPGTSLPVTKKQDYDSRPYSVKDLRPDAMFKGGLPHWNCRIRHV